MTTDAVVLVVLGVTASIVFIVLGVAVRLSGGRERRRAGLLLVLLGILTMIVSAALVALGLYIDAVVR